MTFSFFTGSMSSPGTAALVATAICIWVAQLEANDKRKVRDSSSSFRCLTPDNCHYPISVTPASNASMTPKPTNNCFLMVHCIVNTFLFEYHKKNSQTVKTVSTPV